MIGRTVARLAVQQGYEAMVSNSRDARTVSGTMIDQNRRGRREVWRAEPLAGKVLLDANSFYPQHDSQMAALDSHSTTARWDCLPGLQLLP